MADRLAMLGGRLMQEKIAMVDEKFSCSPASLVPFARRCGLRRQRRHARRARGRGEEGASRARTARRSSGRAAPPTGAATTRASRSAASRRASPSTCSRDAVQAFDVRFDTRELERFVDLPQAALRRAGEREARHARRRRKPGARSTRCCGRGKGERAVLTRSSTSAARSLLVSRGDFEEEIYKVR